MPGIQSLDGPWKFRYDPEGKGLKCGYNAPHFDDSGWKEMPVPSNWYRQGLDENGAVWFRRRFRAAPAGDASLFMLCFDGVDYRCQVWLNGKYLGDHAGYFAHFKFNVTPALLKDEENVLAVEVKSPDDPGFPFRKKFFKGGLGHWDMRPGGWTVKGQEHGSGGIWQSVYIKTSDAMAITEMIAAPKHVSGEWQVNVELELRALVDADAEVLISLSPHDFEGRKVVTPKRELCLSRGINRYRGTLVISDPELWWTHDHGRPNLYDLCAEVYVHGEVADCYRQRIGFRSLAWRDDGLYLNGKRVYLRGACYLSSLWLADMTEPAIRRDLLLVREANMNTLRLPYHIEPYKFYDVCDELGILIWQDFPMLWDYDTGRESRAEARKQVRAMVRQLHHHPCIFKWVCHCEPLSIRNRRMDQELAQTAAEEEKTGRQVRPASNMMEHPFDGWYVNSYLGFLALPGKPLPSEFGAQSLPGKDSTLWKELAGEAWPPNPAWEYHNFQTLLGVVWDKRDSLEEMITSSQEYQARLLDLAVQAFRRAKGQVIGSYLFTFIDAWPSITWSIVDVDRNPKAAYHAVSRAYKPVKVSIDLLREHPMPRRFMGPFYWNDRFEQRGRFFARLWVINDMHREMGGVMLRWSAKGAGKELFKGEIPLVVGEDSARIAETIDRAIPLDASIGEYRLLAELWQDGTLLDQESLPFHVTRPGGRRAHSRRMLLRQWKEDCYRVVFALGTFPRYLLTYLRGGYRRKKGRRGYSRGRE